MKGTANYKNGVLTITTRRHGKPFVVAYAVEDVRPDPRVASPAFSLTKEDGEVYHVSVNEWGPACSCPDATFRGHSLEVPCKHCLAMAAVGLLK